MHRQGITYSEIETLSKEVHEINLVISDLCSGDYKEEIEHIFSILHDTTCDELSSIIKEDILTWQSFEISTIRGGDEIHSEAPQNDIQSIALKKYTKEQLDLFEKMFDITSEETRYVECNLNENGEIEHHKEIISQHEWYGVNITLSNGNVYSIDYGMSYHADEKAIEAFNKLIELNGDEKLFEEYLKNEPDFYLDE